MVLPFMRRQEGHIEDRKTPLAKTCLLVASCGRNGRTESHIHVGWWA